MGLGYPGRSRHFVRDSRFSFPMGETLRVLTLLFAAYAFVEGILNGIIASHAPKGKSRWCALGGSMVSALSLCP